MDICARNAVRQWYNRRNYGLGNYKDGRRLPAELWEHIFRYLDARTFCTSRLVCRSWNAIIKPMQTNKSVWRMFCINEIPGNVLEDILCNKSYQNSSDFDWINIYKKWFSSKMIRHSEYCKKKCSAFYENPITVARISGSWIITGHANGRLCIWNMITGELDQSFMCHLMVIRDIALVDLLNHSYYHGDHELPFTHHHIITISKDSYINVMSLLEPMVLNDPDETISTSPEHLMQLRIFNDLLAVRTRDNSLILFKMKTENEPYFHLELTELQRIAGPMDYIACLGLWHGQILCISHGYKVREFRLEDGGWTNEYPIPRSGESLIPSASLLCRGNISFLLTDDGKIIISVGGGPSTQCYLREKLGTDIIAIAFHATILALGGENGKLFLYYIPNEEHLIYRDYTLPDCVISLSEVSIITMDISLQHNTPVVIASSTDNIYAIRWHKKKEAEPELPRNEFLEFITQRL